MRLHVRKESEADQLIHSVSRDSELKSMDGDLLLLVNPSRLPSVLYQEALEEDICTLVWIEAGIAKEKEDSVISSIDHVKDDIAGKIREFGSHRVYKLESDPLPSTSFLNFIWSAFRESTYQILVADRQAKRIHSLSPYADDELYQLFDESVIRRNSAEKNRLYYVIDHHLNILEIKGVINSSPRSFLLDQTSGRIKVDHVDLGINMLRDACLAWLKLQENDSGNSPTQLAQYRCLIVACLTTIGAQYTHDARPKVIDNLVNGIIEFDPTSGRWMIFGKPADEIRPDRESAIGLEAQFACLNRLIVVRFDQIVSSASKSPTLLDDVRDQIRDLKETIWNESPPVDLSVRYKLRRERCAIAGTLGQLTGCYGRFLDPDESRQERIDALRLAVRACYENLWHAEIFEVRRGNNQLTNQQLTLWMMERPTPDELWMLVSRLIQNEMFVPENTNHDREERRFDRASQTLALAVMTHGGLDEGPLTQIDIERAQAVLKENARLDPQSLMELLDPPDGRSQGHYAAVLAIGYHVLARPNEWSADEVGFVIRNGMDYFFHRGDSAILHHVGLKFGVLFSAAINEMNHLSEDKKALLHRLMGTIEFAPQDIASMSSPRQAIDRVFRYAY